MLCSVSATISLTVSTSQPERQLRHELPHLLHLVVVGAADEIDELCVRRAQHRATGDQPAGLELAAERQRARLRDDRLVEVEERCRRSGHRAHALKCRQNGRFPYGDGRFTSTGRCSLASSSTGERSVASCVSRRRRSIAAWMSTAPLLVSADPLLVADVQRLCAAAGVVPEVVRDAGPGACGCGPALPSSSSGADCAAALAASSPPRRQRVHVLGRSPVGGRHVPGRARRGRGDGGRAACLGDLAGGAAHRRRRRRCRARGDDRRDRWLGGSRRDRLRRRARRRWPRQSGRTLLVDADPIGAGIDRVLGLESSDGIRWDSMLQTTGQAELALAARGAAAHRTALGADLAHRSAGLAAGVRDARGALGGPARLRRGGRRPAPAPGRGGRRDDQPL